MREDKVIYSGKVERDVFGSWDDCDPGLYIDHDMVTTIFSHYMGENVRVTIEIIAEEE